MIRTLRGNLPDSVARGISQIGSTELAPDVYGKGELIESFQALLAEDTGKQAGVFFPSGTMAQQIILRIWADRRGKRHVAYHPTAHVEIHEQDGLKVLHQMQVSLIGEKHRLFTLQDVKKLPLEDIAAVLIELPQREIGGQLPSWEELVAITQYLRERAIYLHLDGARLLETLPFYKKSLPEVCALFDSVYLSFYKTLGGISGAMLLGDTDVMEEARIWKRRYGGDLFHLYPYVLSARTAYEQNKGHMEEYGHKARSLAKRFREIPWITVVPDIPQTNMFHLYFDANEDHLKQYLRDMEEQIGLRMFGNISPSEGKLKTEFTAAAQTMCIEDELLDRAFAYLMKYSE